jgi:hypothetical protein
MVISLLSSRSGYSELSFSANSRDIIADHVGSFAHQRTQTDRRVVGIWSLSASRIFSVVISHLMENHALFLCDRDLCNARNENFWEIRQSPPEWENQPFDLYLHYFSPRRIATGESLWYLNRRQRVSEHRADYSAYYDSRDGKR